jgi:hydroxymethylpyrimidine pyrophosphatase-like HAD family hydrolase
MLKLVAFDLDGTLAPQGGSIPPVVGKRLQDLERSGIRICIASGKNYQYLLDRIEPTRVSNAVVLGENGCVVYSRDPAFRVLASTSMGRDLQSGVYLLTAPVSNGAKIASTLRARYGDAIRFQANLIQLTVFPAPPVSVAEIAAEFRSKATNREIVIEHPDAVDLMPRDWDKGLGLSRVQEVLRIDKGETVAVGNAENDLPMFRHAARALIIGESVRSEGAENFRNIEDALTSVEAMSSLV